MSLIALSLILSSIVRSDDARTKAQKLLDQMTLDEKVQLLHGVPLDFPNWEAHNIIGYIPGIKRLGIPDIRMNDGPQGYRCDYCHGTSTAFPSGLTLAASWNETNAYEWGKAMGEEFYAKGANVQLGPGMNLARIPQNGRNFEYISGEDPTLGKMMAPAAIRGIQDTGIIAVAKHYIANTQETQRGSIIAEMDWKTHMELYAPMFEASIAEGKVGSFMCSYNKLHITGTEDDQTNWSCENSHTLITQLRKMWKFDGWIMSDWAGTHSTVMAANNGLDQEMGFNDGQYFGEPLKNAVRNGQVSQAVLDNKVMNILYKMEQFGLMERQVTPDHTRNVTSDAHNMVARNVATDGIVLLKNKNSILPLKRRSRIAVMGQAPVAGGGSGAVTGPYLIDGRQGVVNVCDDCEITSDLQGADYIVFVIGTTSAEATDRPNLDLPQNDLNTLKGILDHGMGDKMIVVVTNPGPVLLPFSKDVAGILLCFMSGQEFGNAVADILFGVVNPSGRLPITIPNRNNEMKMNVEQYPGVNGKTVYSEGLLVGYRWYDVNAVDPLYEFGFGLSYTSFSIAPSAPINEDFSFALDLKNTGDVDGAEVVQIYLTSPNPDPTTTEPPSQDCDAMLKRMATDSAGTYSCGSRIQWLEQNKGMSEAQAYAEVAKEFPDICVCDDPPQPDNWSWGSSCGSNQDGDCSLVQGCEDCRWSWPQGSSWNDPDAKCRCKSSVSQHVDDDLPKMKQLVSFQKVFVKAGETKTLEFTLTPRDLQSFDMGAGDWKTVPGSYSLHFGFSSRNLVGSMKFSVQKDGSLMKTLGERQLDEY